MLFLLKKKLCGTCLLFMRRHTCYVFGMEIALVSFYMKINCLSSNYIRIRPSFKFIFKNILKNIFQSIIEFYNFNKVLRKKLKFLTIGHNT